MKKLLLILLCLPMIGFGQPEYLTKDGNMDFLKDLRDDEGNIMWENITTSELSMDFHFTLGTSESYANHQQKIRDRAIIFHKEAQKYHLNLRDDSAKARKERGEYLDMTLEEERIFGVYGLAATANLTSVFDCEREWASYVNNISRYKLVVSDTIAFTKNHNIFNYLSKDDYDYYSTYGEFALKDYKIKGDFNDDGHMDQLIFFSFCHHEKGTAFNTAFQSAGENFNWRKYQGFGLVTKYNKYGKLYLIKIGLEVPFEIINTNNAVAERVAQENKLFRNK